jgi:glycine/D-amino acid oxidase-like deaminating enzyme
VEKAGVAFVEDAQVQSIRQEGRICVDTSQGEFRGSQIAITAGAWSGHIASMVGVNLPISLDVNMVSVTEPAGPTIGNIVTHARGILTLKQVANGSCLIGGGWQGVGTLDDLRKDVSYDQIVHNLRLALRVIPGLRNLNVLRSWAGYEGVTPDSLPHVGRLPGRENIYCAACARGGFTMGPLFGRLLGEYILTGSTSKPIGIFEPGRFANAAT